MKEKQKVYVLGIDGATYRVIDPLVKDGELPNFERVMKEGVYGTLMSTIPPLSGPAWVSFATGTTPANHGIFDFILKKPNSYETYYINSRHVKAKPFWNILGDHGKKVIVQNIMVTYPPYPVNGYLITGGLTPPGRPYTYPKSLAHEIESKFGKYPHLPVGGINVAKNGERKFIEIFYRNMEKRAKITEYLMKEKPWDLFVVMFEGADPLQHEFWKYIDEKHPRYKYIEDDFVREAIPNFYKKMDEFLGKLIKQLDENTTLFIVSDHGFGRLEKYFIVNNFLMEIGMLKLKKNIKTKLKKFLYDCNIDLKNLYELSKKLGLMSIRSKFRGGKAEAALNKLFLSVEDIDWKRTKAFSVGTGGHIYINLEGREPQGVINKKDYEDVVNEIIDELKKLEDPENGGKVIEEIYTKQEIYTGKFADVAPDISFVPKEGYATLHREQLISFSTFIGSSNTGYHRREGIIMVYGKEIEKKQIKRTNIYDVAPSICKIFDIDTPKMNGSILHILGETKEHKEVELLEKTKIKYKIKKLKRQNKI